MTAFEGILANDNRPRLAAALLRIATGVMFLRAAWPKVSALEEWPGRMAGFLNFQENTPEWYRSFLDSVVIPNAEVFGYLTALGELAVGLALVAGVLTRPALIGGLIMVVNYWLAKGVPFWSPSSNDSFLILILLALLFMRPGHFLGLDAKLAEKYPKLAV